jgi:hypothetical protein
MAVSWLKKGAESVAAAKQEAVEAEVRKSEQGKMFRFFLKEAEECQITFVDGDLSPEGFLLPPRYYEHMVFFNGQWTNFVCPEKTAPHAGEKCPICEGNDRPSLVSVFTVIDHRIVVSKKDANKTYKDTPKLFVAKPQTFELLNKLAIKRGGLAGVKFDVSRVGDKAAAVGSMFDFVDKTDLDTLKAKYMIEKTDPKTNAKSKVSIFAPADYESEIVYRSADELRKMGFGAPAPSGFGGNPGGQTQTTEAEDYASQL